MFEDQQMSFVIACTDEDVTAHLDGVTAISVAIVNKDGVFVDTVSRKNYFC